MSKVIFFDWDNTVVREDYLVDNAEFVSLIKSRQDSGWLIGLNSDTPLRRLANWQKSLGMNGPTIAENGAVVRWPDTKPLITSNAKYIFTELRQEILDALTRVPDLSLFVGDSTEFIKSVKRLSCADRVVVIFDAYRLCSIGLFVRHLAEDGSLVKTVEATEEVSQLLKSHLPETPLITSIDPSGLPYGFLCISAADVNKSVGVMALIEARPEISDVIMVGDSMRDYISLSPDYPRIHNFAVGNACQELKQIADYVAKEQFAEGCSEILSYIGVG